MALTYENDSKIKPLAPVLDEHAEWYGHVISRSYYPESFAGEGVLEFPESFKNWIEETKESDFLGEETLKQLLSQHDELHEAARTLIHVGKSREGHPELRHFEDFSQRYEQFVLWLHRVEREALQAESGFDTNTGLRTKDAMNLDLAKEMERRSRRGKPFCIALARIDHYERLTKVQGDEDHQKMIKAIGGVIKQCIRSFDDGYRATDSEFILSLKQSNLTGGNAVIERMRRLLLEAGLKVMDEGKEFPVTMSFCIAEPAPGDDVNGLIDNMRQDLDRYEDETDGNTALEYVEQSPLKRFVDSMDGGPSGHA